VTVLDKMREMGVYHDNSRDYIMQLMEITPTAANVVRYAGIVRDKAMLRGLAVAAGQISDAAYAQEGTPAEILEAAEKKIYDLRKGERGDSLEHIGTVLHKYFDHLTELSQSDSMIPGLSTGFMDLDSRINGLNKSDLVIMAARPGMGKTAFALNLAANVAKKYNKTVAVFNLEMSREQIAMRLLSSESFIELQKLATGKLSEEEWNKLCMSSAALSQTDIRVDDNPTVTVADMTAKCRRLDNLGLIIIDYLQLMSTPNSGKGGLDNRVQVVSEMSRGLKVMAKELNIPVICLSQLSRAVEGRSDKRPVLSDLRESGSIEQDADAVLALYRDDYYNEDSEEKGIVECIVLKNRHGETGTIKLQWLGQYQRFSDKEWKHA
jgi:replicative DNA helicase